MPHFCAALNCANKSNKKSHLSYFRFPKQRERCLKWVQNTRRKDLDGKNAGNLNSCYRLCSQHFEDSQFTNSLKNRLLSNAIPTIFNITNQPNPFTLKRKLPVRHVSSSVSSTPSCSTIIDAGMQENVDGLHLTQSSDGRSGAETGDNENIKPARRYEKQPTDAKPLSSLDQDVNILLNTEDLRRWNVLKRNFKIGPDKDFLLLVITVMETIADFLQKGKTSTKDRNKQSTKEQSLMETIMLTCHLAQGDHESLETRILRTIVESSKETTVSCVSEEKVHNYTASNEGDNKDSDYETVEQQIGDKTVKCEVSSVSQENQDDNDDDDGSGDKEHIRDPLFPHLLDHSYYIDLEQTIPLSQPNRLKLVMQKEMKKTPQSCPRCKKVFNTLRSISRHVSHCGHVYKCERCGMCFTRKAKCAIHYLNNVHQYLKVQVVESETSSTEETAAISHELKILRIKKPEEYKCKFCDHLNVDRMQFNKHVRSEHFTQYTKIKGKQKRGNEVAKKRQKRINTARNQTLVICDKCGKFLQKTLSRHICKVDEKPHYTCIVCEKKHFIKRKMKECCRSATKRPEARYKEKTDEELIASWAADVHTHDWRDMYNAALERGILECKFCSRNFATVESFRKHISMYHIDVNPVRCDQCNKLFRNQSNVKTHIKLQHGAPSPCRFCGKHFLFKNLQTHIRTMHEPKVEKLGARTCDICSLIFKNRRAMLYHRTSSHTEAGSAPSVCKICGLTYKTYRELVRHKATVHGLYYCTVCRVQWAKHNNEHCQKLKLRRENHNQVKQIVQRRYAPRKKRERVSCPVCGKSVADKLVSYHMQMHDNSVLYKCGECEKQFARKSDCSRHVLAKHVNIHWKHRK